MIYQAAKYRFARVIGVEISAKLNDIARGNIERNRDKLLCSSIELIATDAAEFECPTTSPSPTSTLRSAANLREGDPEHRRVFRP